MNQETNPLNIDLNNLDNLFINVSFVKDSKMLELNTQYKGKEYPTDVLSFNINEKMEDGKFYLGDIVVNVDQAGRQASEYGNDLRHEIAELVEHGVLHLLGVHHEHDE
jgi:probable rRNA maturation factor